MLDSGDQADARRVSILRQLLNRVSASEGAGVLVFALAYAGSSMIQKGLGFLLFLWFAHSLPVEDYARFGLLYSLQSGVAALAMAGVIETAIGGLRSARSQEQQYELLSSANLVFLGGALASVVLVTLGFSWSKTFTWIALIVAGMGGALTAFFTVQSQLSRIVERHKIALFLGLVPPLIGLCGGLVGFLTWRSATGFFIGYVCGLIVALPLARVTRIGVARPARSGNLLYILHHIGPYILVALVDWFSGYGNTYLVKIFFTTETVARFVFAYTLSSLMHLIATSLNQAWNPRIFKLIHAGSLDLVETENRRFYLLQGAILGGAGAVILIALPFALQMAGAGMVPYRGLQTEIFILFAAYVCVIPWYHTQNYYYAHARGALLMRISIVSSVLGLTLWFCAALLLGPIGAYIGFFLMMTIKMACGLIVARRIWGVRLLWHGPVVGLGLLALSAVGSAALS